jgi:hypothetical protein
MKTRLLPPFAAALSLPLFGSFDFGADRVRFAPAEGLSLEKSFVLSNEMVMDEMRMLMNGEPPPMDMQMEMSGTTTMTVQVVDTYVKLGAGRPSKLAREYASLGTTSAMEMTVPMMGEQQMDATGSSELTGKTVHFTWNEESGGFEPSFPEGQEADAALLEDLAEDLDMRDFLPNGDVEVDESWDIDPQAIVALVAPGGDLKITPDNAELAEMSMGSMGGDLRQMLGEVKGSVKATFKGFREEGDAKLAVIALEVDVESAAELTELIREQVANQEILGGEMEVESADAEMTLKGSGELLFNAAAGHFSSLTLSFESTQIVDTVMNMNMGGQEMKLEQGMDFSATISLQASAKGR